MSRPLIQSLKRFLPPRLVARLQEATTLAGTERATYLRLLILRAIGLRRDRTRLGPGTGPLVFICHGNIIRSAMAEAMFRRESAQSSAPIAAASAGLFAKSGRSADGRAAEASAALGAPLDAHRASPLTEEVARSARQLIVMDRLNEAVLLARFPWAAPKTALLGALGAELDPATGAAIADPFSGTAGDVDATARRIARAVARLARDLRTEERSRTDSAVPTLPSGDPEGR